MRRDTQKRFKDFKFQVVFTDSNIQTETLIKGHLLRAYQERRRPEKKSDWLFHISFNLGV